MADSDQAEGRGHVRIDLTTADHLEVREQIRAIENCRNLVFIGTFAAVGACLMTTMTIIAPEMIKIAGELSAADKSGVSHSGLSALQEPRVALWMFLGTCASLGFLTIGIVTTVLKAREINLRKGYLAALESFVCIGDAPKGYIGWERYFMLFCDRNEFQDRTKEFQIRNLDGVGCYELLIFAEEAALTAQGSCADRDLVSGLVSSFTALSAVAYLIAYAILCGLLVLASSIELSQRSHASALNICAMFAISVTIGAIAFYGSELVRHQWPALKNKSWPDRIPIVSTVVCIILLIVCLFLLFMREFGFADVNKRFISLSTLGPFSTLVTILACYLYSQLKFCRKGKYSFEAFFFMWDSVFKAGPIPIDKIVERIKDKFRPQGAQPPRAGV